MDIGVALVRRRIAQVEAEIDAKILEVRKTRREKLLAEARKNPKPMVAGGMATWFRGRRMVVTL